MLHPQRHALARWSAHRSPVRLRALVGGLLAVVLLGAGLMTPSANATDTGTIPVEAKASEATVAPTVGAAAPAYAYYYLWWSAKHWHDKLGPNYPYSATPLPLPATLGTGGCPPTSLYSGNKLTDVPTALWTQDDPWVIKRDVRKAASAGLAGFLVNWAGTGSATQVTADSTYSKRLATMVAAVHKVQGEGIPFRLQISLKASSTILTTTHIKNDLAYLLRTYGTAPAFDRSRGGKILLAWTGSRKYSVDALRTVSSAYRSKFFIVGDESRTTWTAERAAWLDGDAYYWSTQDPYGNPASFGQLKTLAAMVRGSGTNPDGSAKVWLAPFTPGYDSKLNGGSTCIPRNDGDTMRALFHGNSPTNPDGWALISWNEITEASYVQPLRRYGGRYLTVLRELLTGAG